MWVSRYKKFFRESGALLPAITYAGGFIVWTSLFKLLTLTLVTYFLMSPTFRLQDISEAFNSNRVILAGVSAGFFLLFLILIYPLAGPVRSELWSNGPRFRDVFMPNLMRGVFFASILVSVLLMGGYYHYIGYLIHSDENFVVILSLLLRTSSLFLLIYCEEFIFRDKILGTLRRKMPDVSAVMLTNVLYTVTKQFQFDLDPMQLGTVFLISTILGFKTIEVGSFKAGAGILMGFLAMLHLLLGLPIFQNEFSGIFLIKYQQIDAVAFSGTRGTAKFLTGGDAGPLSGFLLQTLILIEFTRQYVKLRVKSPG